METIYTLQPTCAASPEDATAEPTTPHPWNCYVISVAFPSSLLAQRMCRWPCVAADQRLIFTTITRKDSRSRVQPPSQHTSQSPKREPSVTGVRRRRYFVSSRIALTVIRVSTFIDQAKRNVKSGMARPAEALTKDLSHLAPRAVEASSRSIALPA